MTKEEKAIAYDKAIEKIKYVMGHGVSPVLNKEDLQDIFPEIKESNDERIANAIKKHLDMEKSERNLSGYFGVSYQEAVAWLEKQGKPFDDNIITRDDEILQAISIGLTDAEKDLGWSDFGGLPIEEIQDWLEKQAPKPKWSEEDEKHLETLDTILLDDEKIGGNVYSKITRWLTSLKQRMEEQQ